jgi:HSP20 family molecular chaperone IbpA
VGGLIKSVRFDAFQFALTKFDQSKVLQIEVIKMVCHRVRSHRFHPFHPYMMMGAGMHGCRGRFTEAAADSPFMENKARVTDSGESFEIRMDVPGVKAEKITIEEKDGEIEVVAIRMNGVEVSKTYQEILYVDPLKADLSQAEATLKEGVLAVKVPKKIKPDSIQVEVVVSQPPSPTEEEFRVSVDLPGVKASDLVIKIRDDALLLRGRRSLGENTFELRRLFETPRSADMTQARAFLVDGVFTLVAPQVESPTTPLRTIPVHTEIPSVASLRINDEQQEDDIMVETVEEKEWEHVDDSKPPAKD